MGGAVILMRTLNIYRLLKLATLVAVLIAVAWSLGHVVVGN
jgi:hypothetical protein